MDHAIAKSRMAIESEGGDSYYPAGVLRCVLLFVIDQKGNRFRSQVW